MPVVSDCPALIRMKNRFALHDVYFNLEAVKLAQEKVGETMKVDQPVVLKKPFKLPKPFDIGTTITISKDEKSASQKQDQTGK